MPAPEVSSLERSFLSDQADKRLNAVPDQFKYVFHAETEVNGTVWNSIVHCTASSEGYARVLWMQKMIHIHSAVTINFTSTPRRIK
jgi:hypothetical protein